MFTRFARLQFLPIIIAPILVGTGAAWHVAHTFDFLLLALLLVGSAFLHIASNSIDDVYDFLNGVDRISEGMFPTDFQGWKPIPRGLLSVYEGLAISFVFYSLSIAIGIYLSVLVGWIALAIAIPGVLLSYFYVAPPAKLDYRGLGLGEIAIFLSFGPIPALGAFYVMSGGLSLLPAIVGIPSGLLTVTVLLTHDMIYYDSYRAAAKRSLTVVLGRARTEKLVLTLGVAAYALASLLVVIAALPASCLIVVLALPLLLRSAVPARGGKERPLSQYGQRTQMLFVHSVIFSLLMVAGLAL